MNEIQKGQDVDFFGVGLYILIWLDNLLLLSTYFEIFLYLISHNVDVSYYYNSLYQSTFLLFGLYLILYWFKIIFDYFYLSYFNLITFFAWRYYLIIFYEISCYSDLICHYCDLIVT